MLDIARKVARAWFGALFLLAAAPALGLNFNPTETEWATWPEYCRVRYTVSAAGKSSEFSERVDPSLLPVWQARLGDAWYGLHHHCASLALAERGRFEKNPAAREHLLGRAISESSFTLNRTPRNNPMFAEIATHIGMVHRMLKEGAKAQRMFDMAISTHPSFAGAYQGKAILLRDQGRYTEARDVLQAGDKATNGESPELKYFLGLVLFDLKDFEGARQNARMAYDLGYPLPGLRDKLARAGHPL